jgi:hypothetical protein
MKKQNIPRTLNYLLNRRDVETESDNIKLFDASKKALNIFDVDAPAEEQGYFQAREVNIFQEYLLFDEFLNVTILHMHQMRERFFTKYQDESTVKTINIVIGQFYDGCQIYKKKHTSYWKFTI